MLKGVFEYSGIQRCGKSTLMMADWLTKVVPAGFRPEDTWANFRINVPGVHCMNNAALIEQILRMKREKIRNQCILFDEVGQELKARSYTDKTQTELVNFAWQMPKRGWVLAYCSNVGNSADIILRLATWQTIMPRYFFGSTRAEDYIVADVIFNYSMRLMRGIKVSGLVGVQGLFDSFEPIE